MITVGWDLGRVTALFDADIVRGGSPYDISAEGQRFLINTLREEASVVPITVVLNWTARLTR